MGPSVKGVTKGKCLHAQSFNYEIIKKIDDHHYEMVGNEMSPHALVETKTLVFKNTGVVKIMLKYVGSKEMEMNSGFSQDVDIWD